MSYLWERVHKSCCLDAGVEAVIVALDIDMGIHRVEKLGIMGTYIRFTADVWRAKIL